VQKSKLLKENIRENTYSYTSVLIALVVSFALNVALIFYILTDRQLRLESAQTFQIDVSKTQR